jgi:uncharacterized protein YcbX
LATGEPVVAGAIAALWRYPVKSLMGEELNAADLTGRGLLGDRAWALIDAADGKVVSAKNPRKWPALFDCRAAFVASPEPGLPLPAVRISLSDGSTLLSDEPDADRRLSKTLGRAVRLVAAAPAGPTLEEYWPDVEGLARRDEVTDEAMPPGTFFDLASVHVLATSTLDRLRQLDPAGRYETRRFRPNVVIAPSQVVDGFIEDSWLGRTLSLGSAVRLEVTVPCARCVMTTLAQGDLPKDPSILRTAVQHHGGHVGVYAEVAAGGRLKRGDVVTIAG